jgi:hypothetical protein
MKLINSEADIIDEFISLGNASKKITHEITGENVKNHIRETQTNKKSNDPVDIIAITNNFKVGYEVYHEKNLPPRNSIIQKIQLRRQNRKDVTEWAAIIPDNKCNEYGDSLSSQGIHVIGYNNFNNTRQIKFCYWKSFGFLIKK